MNLTHNFTLDEMTRSTTATRFGIDNTPDVGQITNLQKLCVHTLEPVRDLVGGKSINVSSGFRCPKLNKQIGGSPTSDHMNGNACDFTVAGMTVTEVVELVAKSKIPFDQLIHEFGVWVHISFREGSNRGVILRAVKNGKSTIYENYFQ